MSFQLTDTAIEAVKEIVSSADDAHDPSGMRIAPGMSREGQLTLALSVVAVPATDDQVIESDGARVFVASDAIAHLEDKTLDASFEDRDRVAFSLVDRR